MTLREVGEELGVSREAVRQLESRARSKLLRCLAQEEACRKSPARRRDAPQGVRRAATRQTP